MKTALKEESPFTVLMTVSLDAGELTEYVDKARTVASKDLSVDGFRKGKVPNDVASLHLTDEQIREASLQIALEESFSRAVQEQKWDVARTEELTVKKNTPQELTYSVRVRLWPNIDLGDMSRFAVEHRQITVNDEKITEAMDTIRNMRASFMDKEGPVAQGDRVEIDFSAAKDGKPIPGAEGKSHPLVIGGKAFMPGFEEALVGLRAGDTKEFDLTAPKDYAHPELAGQKLHFTATIKKVQLVMRPEVNEEFAKSLKYDNVEALNKAVKESVRAQEVARERERVRLAIIDAILAQVDAPTPEYLVHEETEAMIRRFENDLQSKGLGMDLYLARLNKTRDDLKKQWKKEAQRQVRLSLVLRQVIKDQRIMADDSEVESTLKDTLGRLSGQEGFAQETLDMDALRRTVADRIVTEKAFAYLERTCITA